MAKVILSFYWSGKEDGPAIKIVQDPGYIPRESEFVFLPRSDGQLLKCYVSQILSQYDVSGAGVAEVFCVVLPPR